jgi:hypothetical protein
MGCVLGLGFVENIFLRAIRADHLALFLKIEVNGGMTKVAFAAVTGNIEAADFDFFGDLHISSFPVSTGIGVAIG